MSGFPQQEDGHNPEYAKQQALNSPMYAKQLQHNY